jgi:hypothetical protein
LPAAEAQDVLRPETIQIEEEADAAALLRVFPLAVLHIRA